MFLKQSKDAKLFFFQDNEKNHCIAFATEIFFEKVLEKKNE